MTIAIGLGWCLGSPTTPASAASPSVSGLPVVEPSTVVADDATPATITTTAGDGDGYNDIRCVRVLINYTESGGDQGKGRGVMDRDQYKIVSEAMLAVDPTLKFGPCLITPHDPAGSGQWLSALAADPAVRLDFVGYHPYYGAIKANWGHAEGMAGALKDYKAFLNNRTAGIRSIVNQNGRAGCDLIASEWDPVNWDAAGHVQSSMANALGVAETCFTFAEDGVLAGNFWANPHDMVGVRQTFARLVTHMVPGPSTGIDGAG